MTANSPTKHPVWTLAIVSIALFMTALDNLVVGVALPSIRPDLGGSIEMLEWTVNAYTLTFAVLLITGAALGDRFGRKRMFVIGLGIFTGASALAALAPTIESLIAARAAGSRRRHRPAADADAALRGRARREARDGARYLGRRERPRRRARPVRRRRRGRGDRLAVDLLAQRPDRPRADRAGGPTPDRVARPGQAARPAGPRPRRRRPLRPDVRHRARDGARLDVGDRRRLDRRRGGAAGRLPMVGDACAGADAAAALLPLACLQRIQRRLVRNVLRRLRGDLPAGAVLSDRAGLRALRGRPAHAALDRHADDSSRRLRGC